MSTSQGKPKKISGSKTTNATVVLELLKDVGKITEAVPYLEAVAGLLKTVVEMKQEFTESKEAWTRTMDNVRAIQKIVADSLKGTDDRTLTIPEHLKEATAGLDECMVGIAEAFDRMNMKGCKRFLHRREIKADAEECASKVATALQLFQTKLQIKGAMQMDNVHGIVSEGAMTSAAAQVVVRGKIDDIHDRLITDATVVVTAQVTFPVCPSPSHLFTGRVALLESLHKLFVEQNQRVAIIGKGGSGKTQVVLKFVEQKKEESRFSRVFFVDATSVQTIDTAFGLIAQAHCAGSSVGDAREWFTGHAEQWLLIFDNADDPTLDLGQYIPRSSHGNIIVTSRNPEISQHASPDCSITLPDLDKSDAVDLLLKSARLKDSPDHHSLAADIVRELGYLALAVSHAGSYISKSSSLQNYLSLFRSNRSTLLKRKRVQNPDGYSHTVFSAFELSYLKLSKQTKSFLHVLSFFHHSNIPLQIFPQAAGWVFDPDWSTPGCQYLRDFLSSYCDAQNDWQHFLFQDTLEELQQFSIISWNKESSTVSLHSMIHACAGDVVEILEKETSHVIALELLNATTPTGNRIKDVMMCIMLVSHADYLWNYQSIPSIFSADTKIREMLAYIFDKAGSHRREISLRLEIVEIQKKNLGEQHPDTWSSMNNLANTYYGLGRLHEAEQLQEKVLSLRRETLGEQHPDTWSSMDNLSNTYQMLGRLHEAEQLQEKVLSLWRDTLGEQHPDTWSSMNNLATTYRDLGRLHEAEQLQEKVLSLYRETLGEQHPHTWTSMNNLASTYYELGRLHEAEQLDKKVLSLRRETLGEQHPDTWSSMGNLALTYHKLGRLHEAEQLQERVLSLYRETLGEQHPHTLISMTNLAHTYQQLGRIQEAEQLQKEAALLQERNPL